MYDALTGRFTFPCPARGEARVTLSSFRQLERLLGAARSPGWRLLQPDDGPARRCRRRAFGRGGAAHPSGRVAVELLLLPGGQAEAGLPLVVLPTGAGRRLARPRRPLPDVPTDVGEPRLARARRPAVPQRPEGRGGRARLQRRPRPYARGFPRRALFRLVRHPPPEPLTRRLFLAGAGYHPGTD